jgi:plasmid stability protein
MSHLVLQDLDPRVIEALGQRGERHGRSIAEEARTVIEDALGLSRRGALDGARRLRRRWEGRGLVASGELLRGDAGAAGVGGAAGTDGTAGAAGEEG